MCVLVGVVTSCVLCARVRGRVSRSCATENTYTPPRLEALFKLSVVAILRHLCRSLQHLCGCTQNPSTCSTRSFLLSAVSQIHLIYVNANLFLSRKIDQFRMLSRLSLGFNAIFATVRIPSSVLLWASSLVVRVPSFKRNWSITTRAACLHVKRR